MRVIGLKFLRSAMAIWDVTSWAVAVFIFVGARYDFVLKDVQWSAVVLFTVVTSVLQLVVGSAAKIYSGRYRIGSFNESVALALIVGLIGLTVGSAFVVGVPAFPRGVALTVPLGALTLMEAGRFVIRVLTTRWSQRRHAAAYERVLIYGAGNAGQQLSNLLSFDLEAPYEVIGFIDDDPLKRHLRLSTGRVIGTRAELVAQAAELGVKTVILAIPSAPTSLIRELTQELDAAGIRLLVLPPVAEMVGGRVELKQLHEVDVEDLLGRVQVDTDLTEIAGYLNGKVVLVTGAGGSIGSEIARQVYSHGPRELVLLDRDESGLHAVQLSIYKQGLLDTRDMVLCDIRDRDALERVFADHRPDVVFHAAALKHLPMLEQYPDEGWKTNVLGTLNVLECAAEHGVRHFVNISTDKAADPTSVLGKTKRKAEELTSWFAQRGHGSYLSVRFGNVLGSRGSVLHTFYSQIESGGPVTVVHPDITRYFMTIPEACELTIQAGAIGEPGDVLVLDMGEPVRIADLARRLIKQSGKEIDIVYTGLRAGEKLHEVLFSGGEQAGRMSHPLISRVEVPPFPPDLVRDLETYDEDTLRLRVGA